MPTDAILPGHLAWICFPEHQPCGREQEGERPAIILAVPDGPTRFPLLLVVPLTSRHGPWQTANPQLYPVLPAGSGGLPRLSVVLLDQFRAVDAARVGESIGVLDKEEMLPIVNGLRRLMHW